MNDPPVTRAQRAYLARFMDWLWLPSPETLARRQDALDGMMAEAGHPLVTAAVCL